MPTPPPHPSKVSRPEPVVLAEPPPQPPPLQKRPKPAAAAITEQYAPRASEDLVASSSGVDQFRGWVLKRRAKDVVSRRAAFVLGATGCGKSSMVRVVLCEAGYRVHEVNGSNVSLRKPDGATSRLRLADYIRDVISRRTDFVDPRQQAVVVDDLDAVLAVGAAGQDADHDEEEFAALAELLAALKPAAPPVVFTCTDFGAMRVCREFAQSCCVVVRLWPVPPRGLASLLERVTFRSGHVLAPGVAWTLASESRGDIRSALLMLESTWRGGGTLAASVKSRDLVPQRFAAAETLLTATPAPTLDAATAVFSADPELVHELLFENYVDAMPNLSIEAVAATADDFSLADLCGVGRRWTGHEPNHAAETLVCWGPRVRQRVGVATKGGVGGSAAPPRCRFSAGMQARRHWRDDQRVRVGATRRLLGVEMPLADAWFGAVLWASILGDEYPRADSARRDVIYGALRAVNLTESMARDLLRWGSGREEAELCEPLQRRLHDLHRATMERLPSKENDMRTKQ